jgi:hypothetical protein
MTLRLATPHVPDPAHPDPVIAELRDRVAAQRLTIAQQRLEMQRMRLGWWEAVLAWLSGGFGFIGLLWVAS